MTSAIFSRLSQYRHLTVLALSVFGFLSFGLYHIDSFITADEHYWVEERVPQYWNAWNDWKLKKTFINDKPGVSLAIVSGIALPLSHYKTTPLCQYDDGRYIHCDPNITTRLYSAFRIPILLINALLLIVIYFAIRAFASRFIASASVFFMAFSPYLVGMSQIINPDALLWSFGALSIFSFFAFLTTKYWRWIFISVISLSGALLSKYVALIIIFFLPLIFLIHHFSHLSESPQSSKKQLFGLWIISLLPLFIFILFVPGILSSEERLSQFFTAGTGSYLPLAGDIILLITTFFTRIHLPASCITFSSSLRHYAFRSLSALFAIATLTLIISRNAFPAWDIFTVVPFDIKNLSSADSLLGSPLSFLDIVFINIHAFVFALPIITLFLFLFLLIRNSWQSTKNDFTFPLISIVFIFFYEIAIGLSDVAATPRYIILLFPLFALLAAYGMTELIEFIEIYYKRPWLRPLVFFIIGIGSILSIATSLPFYTNFSNSLLPKSALISHSWGYGGYEAAQYLNKLPDAKNIAIWSDYYGVCEFFVGRCLTAYTFEQDERDPDYYVLTRRGEIRYMPRAQIFEEKSGLIANQYYDRPNPDWELNINGEKENFVKVYKVHYSH